MSFSLQHHPLLLFLCSAGALAASWWIYRQTIPSLPPGRRTLLAVLRFLSFFLILFLLFEPILRRRTTARERPVIAVLYDNSASIPLSVQVSDSLEPRLPEIRVADDVHLRSFTFASRLSRQPEGWSPAATSMSFEGERTDISAALERVANELQNDHLSGIILVSDGRYNAGTNPVYVAERSAVPIHTVVIGDTTARRDVVIGRISANRVAYAGVEQPVEVAVRSEGYEGATLVVRLFDGPDQVAAENVVVSGATVHVPIALSYVPRKTGLRSMRVSVTELEGEVTHDNNHTRLPVRVLDQKRRVVLFGAAPDPDVAAIRQILEGDDNLEIIARVQKNSSDFYEGAVPDDLAEFDAIVLAGYPGPVSDRQIVSRIRSAIEGGTPAIFLFSRQTNLALLDEIDDVLPVRMQTGRPGLIEAVPVLTSDGLQHPIMMVSNAAAPDWQRLPPLLASESRWAVSPDSRVLARVQIRGVDLEDPLIVARSRAGTRTVAVLGANTWRWKNVPDDLRAYERLWPTLLSQSLQWITAAQDQRPVRVRPTRDVFGGDDPVEFVGEIYDERLQPVRAGMIDIDVTAEDGRRYPLQMRPAGHGRYVLDHVQLPEGTYEYRAVARLDGREIGQDEGAFAVGGLAVEQRDTRADPHLMQQIALRSGGGYLTSEEVDRLPALLSERGDLAPRLASFEREVGLWRHPLFLFLVIALLSAEWVLRKRSGLV